MMIKFDLLKGQGRPVKSNINIASAVGMSFAVPCVLLILMAGSLFYCKADIRTQTRILESYKSRFGNLQKKLQQEKLQRTLQQKLATCLTETDNVLTNYVQWTQFMMLLSRHFPDVMLVDQLEVRVRQVSNMVTKKADPTRKINVPLSARTLLIGMYSPASNDGDRDVKELQDKLSATQWFEDNVRDILITSRKPDQTQNQDIVRYEMSCVFAVNPL